MPSINMIAPRRAEKKRVMKALRRLILVTGVEIIAIILVTAMMFVRIYNTKTQVADMQMQIDKLQPTVKKIELAEKATKELEPKVQLLADARTCTMHWYGLLDHMGKSMPRSTWLTRLTTAPSPPEAVEATINVNGISGSQELVGEAMLRMHSNPDISNVDLHFTQNTFIGDRNAVEFEFAAVLKKSDSQKTGEGGDKGAKS